MKGNSAVFIASTKQRLMWAVPTVPDISGGRAAYQRASPSESGFKVLGEASMISSRKGLDVLKVDDVSLVDEVFNGAFGGDRDEDFVMGSGVVVPSFLLVKSTKSCLGGMMVSLIFLEGLDEEAWVEAMDVEEK
ncbi:hypothetical protein Tco_1280803 [Tanacetum coccineum]